MQNCTLFSYISHLCIVHWINRVTLLSCWMISKILFNMNIPNKTWLIGRGFLTSSSPINLILQIIQWRKYYHISSSRLAMYMHMCKVKNDFAGNLYLDYFFQFPFCHNTSFQKKSRGERFINPSLHLKTQVPLSRKMVYTLLFITRKIGWTFEWFPKLFIQRKTSKNCDPDVILQK